MKTLYFDCGMGAAGDMLTSALLELIPDGDDFIDELNSLGIPGIEIKKERSVKCGISGTHVTVTVNGEDENISELYSQAHNHHEQHYHHTHDHSHFHRGMHELEHIIEQLKLSEKVRTDIKSVYALIAQAESHVHGVPISDIHFHEVGTMDALADITSVCMLMDRLLPQQVIASPIHVGSGQVQCAHGILPVPAPATAHILKDVPIYGGSINGELCTPTGAALLKYFVSSFGDIPVMRINAIGYGMGKKDFNIANCVRAFWGETENTCEQIFELSCNVDDMSAEEIGFSMERIFDAGALDVFTVPVGMKKNRPGILIKTLCSKHSRDNVVKAIFKYTSTTGIRETTCNRHILERSITALDTPYGQVRRKDSYGYGIERSKYEYEDLARIARDNGLDLRESAELVDNLSRNQ